MTDLKQIADEFDVELTSIGGQKFPVLKVVRSMTGLDLKSAKDLVDQAPIVVQYRASLDQATLYKEQLESVGATVTLKLWEWTSGGWSYRGDTGSEGATVTLK